MTEEQMAASVVGWLRADGWRVYQEVSYRGPRADIVATRGPVLWVVECKLSFGLDVLEQAHHWLGLANLVSVATPTMVRRLLGRGGFRRDLLGLLGIGWVGVSGDGFASDLVPPALRRRLAPGLRDALTPEHETFAPAGNARSDYWTPFQATSKAALDYVRAHPGCTVRQLVEGIRHHYASSASARSSLTHWLDLGKVPGLALRREGRVAVVDLAEVVS